jgi:lysine 2,3-aminomutase
MEEWERLLIDSSKETEKFFERFCVNRPDIDKVVRRYPMRVNPYFLGLIKREGDALWKQCIPDIRELEDEDGLIDPLNEEGDSPVPGLTHRYPDRVLFLVSNSCAMYCRFCTRKRRVGDPLKEITTEQILRGIDYIKEHREVRDVVLSGGDPLLLHDNEIGFILKRLREIKHLEIVRIGTRVPCTLPQRITPELCDILKRYRPLYINIHFNHPREITPESTRACEMLADAGIPLGSQTVLLKGVNDNPGIMKELMHKLLRIRVRPYYIFQCDLTRGTKHFRTPIGDGIEIIENLRGHTSGLCVPHYVIDAPGGGGKIPVSPNYILEQNNSEITLRNYQGNIYRYPNASIKESVSGRIKVKGDNSIGRGRSSYSSR